jgi:hypothetical protein
VRSTICNDFSAALVALAQMEPCVIWFILTQRTVLEVEDGKWLSAVVNLPCFGPIGCGYRCFKAIEVSEKLPDSFLEQTDLA